MLLNADVPLRASQRDETWPLFILGGSNAMATQAIITEEGDGLVDALFFGEGEVHVQTLLRCLYTHARVPKAERLRLAAEQVGALWVAGEGPQIVKKAILSQPRAEHLLVDYPLLNGEEAGTAKLQITYGCPAFCAFCFEGYDRKPYREVPYDEVLEAARHLKARGVETLELYSFNFNTHTDIFALLLALNQRFERVSFKSQRVDILYENPMLLDAEVAADKRSFTLGIEGISPRMRTWLHKSLDSAAIMGVLEALFRQKIREVKLFYILTGHENADDIEGFRTFVAELKALHHRFNPGVRVIFSFGLLIRMPFTPLRYDRLFLEEDDWHPLVGLVKSACETQGFEFRMAAAASSAESWEEYCTTQVLAMGGHWLYEPLIALAKQGYYYDGYRLTSRSEPSSPGYWERLRAWMVHNGYWNADFLGEKPQDYQFALDAVRSDISSAFLYHQYERVKACVDEGYCLGLDASVALAGAALDRGRCLGCGACATQSQRDAITQHVIHSPETPGYLAQLRRLMREKWRLAPLYVRLWVPALTAGVEPAWLNAWVLRNLLTAFPVLGDNLLSAREAFFTTKAYRDRYVGLYGETIFALRAWDVGALRTALDASPAKMSGGDLPGGVRVLGSVSDLDPALEFEPDDLDRRAASVRMQMQLTLPSLYFPDAGRRLRAFLHENYVPVNIRRVELAGGSGYRFDISAKAQKKRIIFEGEYWQDPDAGYFRARLLVSAKFDLMGFIKSFGDRGGDRGGARDGGDVPYHLVRAEIYDLSW
jgi:ferredoxin